MAWHVVCVIGGLFQHQHLDLLGTVGAAAHPGIEPGACCGAKLAPGLGCIEKGQKKGGIGGGNGYMAGPGPMGIGRKGFGGRLNPG